MEVSRDDGRSQLDRKSIVNSVLRACALLDCFTRDQPEMTLGELAALSGLTKPTTRRLLATLEISELIERTQNDGYRLGTKLFRLGSVALTSFDLRRMARPEMRKCAATLGHSAYLVVPEKTGGMCVERIDGSNPVRVMVMEVGELLPYHVGAAPTLLLAFLEERLIAQVIGQPFKVYTPATITSVSALKERLRLIREVGYSVSAEDITPGVGALAVPIFGQEGEVVAALSVAGLTDDFSPDRRGAILEPLMRVGEVVSSRLGAPSRLPTVRL